MSKTERNSNTCNFVMLKGKRKGEICGNPSRGTKCKYHNAKRTEYIKKTNEKKRTINNESKHKKLIRRCRTICFENIKSLRDKFLFQRWNIEIIAKGMVFHMRALCSVLGKDLKSLSKTKDIDEREFLGPYYNKYPTVEHNKNKDGETECTYIEYTDEKMEIFKRKFDRLLNKKDIILKKAKKLGEYIDILDNRIKKNK